jgi:protein-disulfide isomerase
MDDNSPAQTTLSPKKETMNQYLVPLSVVIAGALIAGAVVFTNAPQQNQKGVAVQAQPSAPVDSGSTDAVAPVTPKDHIKGNPDAPIKIVEYSDFECPFCKQAHNTLNELMKKYGDSGDVAWVYRHFPLEQLHPKNAMKVAIASECAAEQGGNDMFWKFTDGFFAVTPSNDRTDLATVLPQIYKEIGLDAKKMADCIESGRYDQHIQDEIENAVATGGRGTPWSILIAPNGKTFSINGAQPLPAFEQLIEIARKEK